MKKTLCRILSLAMCVSLFAGFESAAFAEETDDYSAGSPWVDSNILSNVESSGETSLKDDYNLATNGDWVLDNSIRDGNVRNSFYSAHLRLREGTGGDRSLSMRLQ